MQRTARKTNKLIYCSSEFHVLEHRQLDFLERIANDLKPLPV